MKRSATLLATCLVVLGGAAWPATPATPGAGALERPQMPRTAAPTRPQLTRAGTPASPGVNPVTSYAPPPLLATSAALLDVTAGRWLLLDNADTPLPMASTTKIMTALVALRYGRLDDLMPVDAAAVALGQQTGSNMGLVAGEQLPLRDLLYGLLLASANDAAVTIGAHVAASPDAFVALMNQQAAALGLAHTHYVNPHGLDAPDHYASARDLVLLAQAAMSEPLFRRIVATSSYIIPATATHNAHRLTNINWFVNWYPGADGVKPGYTGNAGLCQVLSAHRGGHWLIGSLLHTPDLHTDARDLMNYGFGDFRWTPSGQYGDSPDAAVLGGPPRDPFLYFPATGHRVRAGFLDYFRRHGAVAVLGLPLTDEFVERGLMVQYFERARLWWDDAAQAAVVTPLGQEAVPSAALLQPVSAVADSATRTYVPITGHTIAHGFLTLYRAWGGSATFGFPLTQELPDGAGTVQYFSNAVFEWSPRLGVTLAPLGRLALRRQGYLR